MKNRKIAMVTGATSGIGKATAYALAANGYDLILTGRRKKELETISDNIKTKHKVNIIALVFDVRDKKIVEDVLSSLEPDWKNISVLINNAGLAVGLNRINDGDTDDWDRMIDTNIKGLLYVSRVVSNFMRDNGSGHIINVGSIASKEIYLNGNVYCATKHAVDALSRGMRLDLLAYGIKVSQISPGLVDTEFSIVRFKGDKERADAVYNGFKPLIAEDIADAILYMVNSPAHINIADLLILPAAQGSASMIERK